MKQTICQLLILAVIACAVFTHAQADGLDDFEPGELVVRVVDSSYIDSMNARYGTTVLRYIAQTRSFLLHIEGGGDAESLGVEVEFENELEVEFCDANYLLDLPEPVQSSKPFVDVELIGTFPLQRTSTQLGLATAHATSTGAGVTVGVIDAGINLSHPLFAGTTIIGYDFIDGDADPSDPGVGPSAGHGTFVAGLVKLVAPSANIAAYRVFDTLGSGDGFSVAEAIVRAVEDGCKVINLSMVLLEKHASVELALEYARARQVVVVASAGNDSTSVERFPALISSVISVAAVDSNNVRAPFSNYGGKIDVCAPGVHLYAPYLDTTFAWWNGSSFAAPLVSGQAALMLATYPAASWISVRDALVDNSINVDLVNPGFEGALGNGLIDPTAALANFQPWICGDMNGNGGNPNIVDLTYLVNYLFRSGTPPANIYSADLDGNSTENNPVVNIVDLTYLVQYFFVFGPPPICGSPN
jgi:subtilisin family serine protease